MLPVFSEAELVEQVLIIAPAFPKRLQGRVRLVPSRHPELDDLISNAGHLGAAGSGIAPEIFAERLVARLAALPHVASARRAPDGSIGLRYSNAALHEILARLASLGALHPAVGTLTLPLSMQRLDDPVFRLLHGYAFCRYLLRAPDDGRSVEHRAEPRIWAGTERAVLCWLGDWPRIGSEASSRRILLYLRQLCESLDRMWDSLHDEAALTTALERCSADRRLLCAASDVLRAGLKTLGIAAAEELR